MHLTTLKKMEEQNQALVLACSDNAKAATKTRDAIQKSNGTFKTALIGKKEP